MSTDIVNGSGNRRPWPILGGLFLAAVAGFGGGMAAYALWSPNHSGRSALPSGACSVTNVAKSVLPSVVTISAYSSTSGSGQPQGDTGSGDIIRSGGYIVTNNHVVSIATGGGSVEVLFSDGSSTSATIVGRDPLTDLAVVKVNVNRSLVPVRLGSSSATQIGEPVVALGAPLGLTSTVTSGIISALDRTIRVPGENGQSALLVNALQTDAAINPGNSGGALVNCDGQLIGIPSAGATVPNESGESSGGSIGLGFAIPVDVIKPIVSQIIDSGKVIHSYMGLTSEPLSSEGGVGLLVTSVTPGGPASAAGIRSGDILIDVDGEPAMSTDQLMEITLTHEPGTTIEVTYTRQGHQATTRIVLSPLP